ncbi:helix-turn-helix transcriptional regulator [Nonomuraea typhae]|uniref:Helix-turn-helix transcriptional regulator n=1 Tax=Nonomuraea typhae TaxID=2603600 RepID=A0ABW7Z692_9ACTN
MLETSVRLLRLLALLQARPVWSGAELAGRLGVTTRTVRNDVERLRILGYEVRSATGTAGGYRLGAGAAMPPLLLDDEEVVAVAVSLQAAASGTVTGIEETSLRALAKVESMLPARLRGRLAALRSATVSVAGRGPTVDAEVLAEVASASRDRVRLRFVYEGFGGAVSEREAEPHRLVYTGRRWYVVAWDVARGDWRTFRADRMRLRVPARGAGFAGREMSAAEAAERVVRGAGSVAWRVPARVRLLVPAEVAAGLVAPAAGLVVADGAEACVLETGGDSVEALAGFLVSLGVGFVVLDPPGLREAVGVLGRRLLEAAQGG